MPQILRLMKPQEILLFMNYFYHKIANTILRHKRYTVLFFIIFYSVGLTGIMLPSSRQFFIQLTPFTLLLSLFGLFLFHSARFDMKTVAALLTIGIAGFAVEVAGVNTGLIFGGYTYGNTLGIKAFNTPLMIGINWIILVYASFSLVSNLSMHPGFKVLTASTVMLLYDIVLEHIAPVLDMWQWEGGSVPFQNYAAWFILSVIFHSFLHIMGIRAGSKIALPILLCQTVFFLLLILFFKIAE